MIKVLFICHGSIRLYDMKPVIKQGGVFKALEDENTFREKLTVLNDSIAWDISGDRDESKLKKPRLTTGVIFIFF